MTFPRSLGAAVWKWLRAVPEEMVDEVDDPSWRKPDRGPRDPLAVPLAIDLIRVHGTPPSVAAKLYNVELTEAEIEHALRLRAAATPVPAEAAVT